MLVEKNQSVSLACEATTDEREMKGLRVVWRHVKSSEELKVCEESNDNSLRSSLRCVWKEDQMRPGRHGGLVQCVASNGVDADVAAVVVDIIGGCGGRGCGSGGGSGCGVVLLLVIILVFCSGCHENDCGSGCYNGYGCV